MPTSRLLAGAMLILTCVAATVHAAVPPALDAALKTFRADPPPGWSYTVTTVGDGKSTVEHCDAAKPDFDRWSLVQVDRRAPTADELSRYAENRSRRSRTGTAPRIVDQLELGSLETVGEDADHARYRCRLRPGEASDKTAAFLRVTLTVHKASQTIVSLELANVGEFAPTLGVKVTELRTQMTYARGTADRPALPLKVATRQRGTAFWLKSLDAEMTVTFSDYERAGKR